MTGNKHSRTVDATSDFGPADDQICQTGDGASTRPVLGSSEPFSGETHIIWGTHMANVNVTYQEMQDAATRVNAGQQEIDSQLAQLKNLIDQLVSSGFVTDSASKMFQQCYEEFNNGASQTIAGLEGIANYLNTAAQTFQDADTQLANALNR
jgi:WXG100 family type VII secretion target